MADGNRYVIIPQMWADEEFLREAKEAFKQLGEDGYERGADRSRDRVDSGSTYWVVTILMMITL